MTSAPATRRGAAVWPLLAGVAVLAESHISIHTWPEVGYAALDVFMCGSANPDACIPVLREAFSAKRVGVNELLRGQDA